MSPDAAVLIDMLLACRRISGWVAGMDLEAFRGDEKTYFAVQHQFMILGEATKRLSTEFREANPSITWREIAGLRDVLTHGYHRVSTADLWQTATEFIPPLAEFLETVVEPESL